MLFDICTRYLYKCKKIHGYFLTAKQILYELFYKENFYE